MIFIIVLILGKIFSYRNLPVEKHHVQILSKCISVEIVNVIFCSFYRKFSMGTMNKNSLNVLIFNVLAEL